MRRVLGPFRGCGGAILLLLLSGWLTEFSLAGEQAEKRQEQTRQLENDGERALAHGNFALAAQDFRSALKLNSNSAEAHSGLGIVLREIGKPARQRILKVRKPDGANCRTRTDRIRSHQNV